MAKPSFAMIVLSQLDTRYFSDISGRSGWSLDFVMYKQGETEVLAESLHARYFSRSVNLELQLDAGEYVVHVRHSFLAVYNLLTRAAGPYQSPVLAKEGEYLPIF